MGSLTVHWRLLLYLTFCLDVQRNVFFFKSEITKGKVKEFWKLVSIQQCVFSLENWKQLFRKHIRCKGVIFLVFFYSTAVKCSSNVWFEPGWLPSPARTSCSETLWLFWHPTNRQKVSKQLLHFAIYMYMYMYMYQSL